MNSSRIKWIDGLKGIACLMVFLHHFLLTFYPASYYGQDYIHAKMPHNLDNYLSYTFLGAFTQGNFPVNIFIMVSALLVSRSIFIMIRERSPLLRKKVRSSLIKRYPRLVLPLAVVAILNYFLVVLSEKYDIYHGVLVNPDSFLLLLKGVFIDTWINPKAAIIAHFWMMPYILWGSFIAIGLALLSKYEGKQNYLFYLLLLIFFYKVDANFMAVIYGTLLGYELEMGIIVSWIKERRTLRNLTIIAGVVVGIFLGGYPSFVVPSGIYSHLAGGSVALHATGAFVLVAALSLLGDERNVLASKTCLFLGKLSYGIYLLHPLVIIYIGYNVYDNIYAASGLYGFSVFIAFAASLAATNFLAYLFNISVERVCEKLLKKLTL